MPKKKSEIRQILSPSHLQAIGLVAAQWAYLEFAVLFAMTKILKIDFDKTLTLAATQNMAAWLQMIDKAIDLSKTDSWRADSFKPISKQISHLHVQRNAIVHATWISSTHRNALAALLENYSHAKASAEGFTIPKRGKVLTKSIAMTAAEMRKIANEIEATERDVISWLAKPKPASPRTLLSLGLQSLPNHRTTQAIPHKPQAPSQGLLAIPPLSNKKAR